MTRTLAHLEILSAIHPVSLEDNLLLPWSSEVLVKAGGVVGNPLVVMPAVEVLFPEHVVAAANVGYGDTLYVTAWCGFGWPI